MLVAGRLAQGVKSRKKIGFETSKGNSEIEGIQVTLDYNKPNDPKVLFEIKIYEKLTMPLKQTA
jgi:hypothetical protein